MKPLSIQVAASVNDCDRLAAEPLDVQGVTKGVLPNEIDVPAAKAACAKAVADYPDVGRFKFEYARALFAEGDFAAAVDNLRQAYRQGHVRAGEWLGRMYQLGVTVARDPAKAIPYFEAAERKGDPYAQYVLGKALIYGKGIKADVPRGIRLLTSAAQSGHTYAMNQLGFEYRYGQHVGKDEERALAFFRKSTEREDVWGMLNLGLLYRDGVGVPKDPDKAMALFAKADAGGQPAAATLISLMKRDSGKASPEEIIAGFRRSAERGDAWGAFDAAEMIRKRRLPRQGPVRGRAPLRAFGLAADRSGLRAGEGRTREASRRGGRPRGPVDARRHGPGHRLDRRGSRKAHAGGRGRGARCAGADRPARPSRQARAGRNGSGLSHVSTCFEASWRG